MGRFRRKSQPVENQGTQRLWKVMRGPLRSGCSVAELVAATSCSMSHVREFMLTLLRCGYVTRIEGHKARTSIYVLHKDTGLHAPRVRYDGNRRCGLYDANLEKDVDFVAVGGTAGTRHTKTAGHARAASIGLAWEPGDFDAGC